MSELLDSLDAIITITGCFGVLWLLFLWPAYQRVVLKREWGAILGHTQEDSEQGD